MLFTTSTTARGSTARKSSKRGEPCEEPVPNAARMASTGLKSSPKEWAPSCIGVPHGVQLEAHQFSDTFVHVHRGAAPVRRYLPQLIELVSSGKIAPGKVFDLTLPLAQVAEGYRATDERRAIKTSLRV
jgi:threonine dehydrogenase-like Zn-dependent dehydrogenase